jgi:7-cyano-7-deazaguanine synthase in queuosine biosynthesis
MQRIQFHFRLSDDEVQAPAAAVGAKVLQVPLVTGHQRLGHCLGETLDQLRDWGLRPTENGIDLLLLASAVYTADKYTERMRNSDDSWTRDLMITLPVHDPTLWNALSPQISKALHFLTGDCWTLAFCPRPLGMEVLAVPPREQLDSDVDAICLFSGGLDSFIGAIDLLEAGHRVLLVSHSAGKTDSPRQKHLVNSLAGRYGNPPRHLRASIQFRSKYLPNQSKEDSERSRSFLFFSIAALASSALPGVDTITVPENGLIALNVPLEEMRLGALSTRTAHPFFMARMNAILTATGIRARLTNPYMFKTKGEMVRECHNATALAAEIHQTISCSSPNSARIHYGGAEHCGYCVPCIIRRAAILNSAIADTTPYGLADLKARPLASDKAEGMHIRAFQAALLRLKNSPLRASVYVHESGPLNDHPQDYEKFAGTYLRGLQEVANLLTGVVTEPS